ncbi:MAG: carboxylating nicotinate-nucleotide diphosphorylase [Balneolaceae bacterium]|nr:carboxylating nicotinate-nucleotide diphosphorylase [Balneolaceae bacterium]
MLRKQETESAMQEIITRALEEDIGPGDVTTEAVIDEEKQAKAVWIAKQDGVISGLYIAEQVFRRLDVGLMWTPLFGEGERAKSGDVLVRFSGRARALLTAERTALNIVQRMSGIATMTAAMAELIEGSGATILDTRKTAPGLREFDKLAVKAGGGSNHRLGLYDMAMIKENHIRAAGSIAEAVRKIRKQHTSIKIEVETTNLNEVDEALRAGADIIMLDNMDLETMRKAVERIGGKAKTEASGNITNSRIKQVAETGVDFISSGALTHSVQAFDISQQITDIF